MCTLSTPLAKNQSQGAAVVYPYLPSPVGTLLGQSWDVCIDLYIPSDEQLGAGSGGRSGGTICLALLVKTGDSVIKRSFFSIRVPLRITTKTAVATYSALPLHESVV